MDRTVPARPQTITKLYAAMAKRFTKLAWEMEFLYLHALIAATLIGTKSIGIEDRTGTIE